LTGWAGAGRTSLLDQLARQRRDSGHLVAATGPVLADGHHRSPFAYLRRLVPDPSAAGEVWCPADAADHPISALEHLARRIVAAAGRRPVSLLLDDLHLADAASLAALPMLRCRTDAVVIASARTVAETSHPRPLVRRAVERLAPEVRVDLPPLDRPALAAMLRRRASLHVVMPVALDRLDRALGRFGGQPGLAQSVWPAARLETDHPLVTEVIALPGPHAALLAAARRTGLQEAHVAPLADVLGHSGDEVARTIDRLEATGWTMTTPAGRRPTLPALADAVTRALSTDLVRALDRAVRSVAPVTRGAATLPGEVDADASTHRDPVLRLLVHGMSNRQIARVLGLSLKAVESRVSRLLDLHGCTNRTQLVALCVRAPTA
jgi:DNA-binding NarL/FixJ family response regulator